MQRTVQLSHPTELRAVPASTDEKLEVLRGVTPRWSSTGEVGGRVGVLRASPVLYGLAGDGLVDVTPPMANGPRWRLTEKGAAMLRAHGATSAPAKGE